MNNKKYRTLDKCRVCGKSDFREYLDLNMVPLANNLVTESTLKNEEKFPLKVIYCNNCSLSQLSIIVDPDILFRNYVYRSSISNYFKNHCKAIAEELNGSPLSKDDLVIDIASNDGCMLQEFKKIGNRVIGVDPAINLAKIANENGIETIPEYWDPVLAEQIAEKYGKAKVIIAVNVFAHINDLHSMLKGIKTTLADKGYFIIESPHLQSLIEKTEFDTIYHEHLSYLLIKPIKILAETHGLRVAKVKKSEIHGGSIRVYLEKKEDPDTSDGSVQEALAEEENAGLHSSETYLEFGKQVEKIKNNLNALLNKLKNEGKIIAAYGASAKGNTLLNYCKVNKETIQYIFDDTPEKQGKLYPGVHIPILAGSELMEKKPDYLLLLAWNFAKEIIEKTNEYQKDGGKYIVPIPDVTIID